MKAGRGHRGVKEEMGKWKTYQHDKIKHNYINNYIKYKWSFLNSPFKRQFIRLHKKTSKNQLYAD